MQRQTTAATATGQAATTEAVDADTEIHALDGASSVCGLVSAAAGPCGEMSTGSITCRRCQDILGLNDDRPTSEVKTLKLQRIAQLADEGRLGEAVGE